MKKVETKSGQSETFQSFCHIFCIVIVAVFVWKNQSTIYENYGPEEIYGNFIQKVSWDVETDVVKCVSKIKCE